MKLALAMIAKDKEDVIERALQSTKGVFDYYCLQDTGSSDNTLEVFKNWCKNNNKQYFVSKKFVGRDYKQVIVDGKPILAEFCKARNDSWSLIPDDADFGFWMDTDDKGFGFEQLPMLADYCQKNNIDMVTMEYIYATSSDGLKPVTQVRERLLNLKKKATWANWVHENYRFEEPIKYLKDTDLKALGFNIGVEHLRTANEALATNRRNNLIMKMQLKEEGIEKFPDEMLSHLAYDHWEHKEWDDCIKYYEILIDRLEGQKVNAEMVYQIFMKLSSAYESIAKRGKAIEYAYRAIEVLPAFADAYLALARIFALIGDWEESSYFADKVLKLGVPKTTMPINEYDYSVIPLQLKLQAALAQNRTNEAIEISERLVNLLPNNPQIKAQYDDIKRFVKKNKVITAVGEIAQYYQENNKAEDLDKVQNVIPIELLEEPAVRNKIKEIKHDFKRKSVKVKWPDGYKKTIVIYAGQHLEQWDGHSDVTKGIGGSEGMCIQLARELAALGNKVVVYNEARESDGKVFDGVTYLHHTKWNSDLKCDVFISLRRPDVFSQLIKATKQYLWLHDTSYGNYSTLNFYSANKVIVLSTFHKDVIKLNHGILDDSIFWITRNGLNNKAIEFADSNAQKRNPFKVIYASSYDRGLENVLEMWPKVVETIPEAHLEIYYGWDTFDGLLASRSQINPKYGEELKRWKSYMIAKIANTPNVKELGRISQNELYKKFAESAIWFYPTEFQEISCITAMTAQAMGAIPVCTPFAALNETVSSKYGVKVPLTQINNALIDALKDSAEGRLEDKRKNMMVWARDRYNMVNLAKEWNTFFNQD